MFIQGIKPLNNTNPYNFSKPAFGISPMAVSRGIEKGFNPALFTDAVAKKAPAIEYKIVNGKCYMVMDTPKKIIFEEPNYKKEVRKLESEDETPKKDTNIENDNEPIDYYGDDITGFDPYPDPFNWESIQYDM